MNPWFLIARILTIVLLLLALNKHPYSYYTLLRFVSSGTCIYGASVAFRIKSNKWSWIFGITAVIFNPFLPIYLDRATWAFIDIATALMILISIFVFNDKVKTGLDTDVDIK